MCLIVYLGHVSGRPGAWINKECNLISVMSWVHMGLWRPLLIIAGLTLRLKVNLFQSSCLHLAYNRAPMTPENLLLESGNDWPVVPGLQVIILQKGSALTGGSRCYQNAKQHHKLRITVAIDDTRRRLTERCSGNWEALSWLVFGAHVQNATGSNNLVGNYLKPIGFLQIWGHLNGPQRNLKSETTLNI